MRRCLEKDPDDRFQSAREVAFALDALSTGSVSESAVPLVPATPTRRWLQAGAALLVVVALVGLGFLGGRRASEKPPPMFKQLTFRRGWLDQARFAPDGRTVIYGAGWDGKPVELFQTRTDSPESRALGLPHAKVLSISPQSQMAILIDPSRQQGFFGVGTLAVVPMVGGTPRELLEDVTITGGRYLRVSQDGRYAAFLDLAGDRIMIADGERKVVRILTETPGNTFGMAWGPKGRELWFTEGDTHGSRGVFAADPEGRRRLVYRSAANLGLVDAAPDGRALLHRSLDRFAAMALLPGSTAEQDVTVNDHSSIGALSTDGRLLLLNAGYKPSTSTYLRRDGGDPIRLAAGRAVDVAPDRRSALVVGDAGELSVVPIGPGLSRRIDLGALRAERGAWLPPPRAGV